MSIFTVTMKTHSRENLTSQFVLNDCIIHHRQPVIEKMVVGRRREVYFVARCEHDDCGKIHDSAQQVVDAWNKWNPKNTHP